MSKTAWFRSSADIAVERIAKRLRKENVTRIAKEAGVSERTARAWRNPEKLKQVREVIAILTAAGVSVEEMAEMLRG